jgi:hypothetical protein
VRVRVRVQVRVQVRVRVRVRVRVWLRVRVRVRVRALALSHQGILVRWRQRLVEVKVASHHHLVMVAAVPSAAPAALAVPERLESMPALVVGVPAGQVPPLAAGVVPTIRQAAHPPCPSPCPLSCVGTSTVWPLSLCRTSTTEWSPFLLVGSGRARTHW